MQIDLDEKELKILRYGMSMYRQHIRECNLEIIELAKTRKSHTGCCIDSGDEKPKLHDETSLTALYEKLRMAEMQLPVEEHKYHQYDYGKTFGYEKAKWDGTETYEEIARAHLRSSPELLLRFVDKKVWHLV